MTVRLRDAGVDQGPAGGGVGGSGRLWTSGTACGVRIGSGVETSVWAGEYRRIGTVTALGLDETLFCRKGRWRTQQWAISMIDVAASGGATLRCSRWLAARFEDWRAQVRYGVLDLSGPYRKIFDDSLPDAVQVADPFLLVRLANAALDDCRRRVQNQTIDHRGRKNDPALPGPPVVEQGQRTAR